MTHKPTRAMVEKPARALPPVKRKSSKDVVPPPRHPLRRRKPYRRRTPTVAGQSLAARTSSTTPALQALDAPKNVLHAVERQLTRATSDDSILGRFIELAEFVRSTVILMAAGLIASSLALGAGIGVAVHFFGIPWGTATGLGVLGTAATVFFGARTAFVKLLAYARTDTGGSAVTGPTAPGEAGAGVPDELSN